jgi:hypothetical protein
MEAPMQTEKDRYMTIEWELWRDLCGRLEETGLVTKADLRAPVAENKTNGQKLIHAIMAWGENRTNEIALRTANRLIGGEEYVITAVREWGSARRHLNELCDASEVA